jgi:hypothetical protein
MKMLGAMAILLFIAVLIRLYHGFMAEIYRDEMQEKLEERYASEIEFRWQNQDIKVHTQLVIVDETR